MELILVTLIRFALTIIFFRIILQTLFLKKSKEETTEQVITAVDEERPSDGKSDYKVVDNVMDPVCGQLINKDNAYIILKDGNAHYFCSWECRQKYVSNMNCNLSIWGQSME